MTLIDSEDKDELVNNELVIFEISTENNENSAVGDNTQNSELHDSKT